MTKTKLQHTNRTDMKKKIEQLDPKPNKINKVPQRKAPLKAEIESQLKKLQVRYDVLEAENKNNVDTIKKLEMQICSNGMRKPTVDMNSQSCQTFFDDILISCNLCIFVGHQIKEPLSNKLN